MSEIVLKKKANIKSTTLELQLSFAHLLEKIHQEDSTRRHIERHKMNTNSTFSLSINILSVHIDNKEKVTVVDLSTKKQHIAYGCSVLRHK